MHTQLYVYPDNHSKLALLFTQHICEELTGIND